MEEKVDELPRMTNEEEEILKQVDENLLGKLSFEDLNVPLVDEDAAPRPHVVLREAVEALKAHPSAYITIEEDLSAYFLIARMMEDEAEIRARVCPCSDCADQLAKTRNAKRLAERISEVHRIKYEESFGEGKGTSFCGSDTE